LKFELGIGNWDLGKVFGMREEQKRALPVDRGALTVDGARWTGEDVPAEAVIAVLGLDLPAWLRLSLVLREQMLSERALWLFAAACAERVLPLFESAFPEDGRPRTAIETARRYERWPSREALKADLKAAYQGARDAGVSAGLECSGGAEEAAYAASYAACYFYDAGEKAHIAATKANDAVYADALDVEPLDGAAYEAAYAAEDGARDWQIAWLVSRLKGDLKWEV